MTTQAESDPRTRGQGEGAKRRAFVIVISGPSGVGKTTIARRVLAGDPDTAYSVSVTTRPPRRDERDGFDYQFVSDEVFDRLVAEGALAEWATVHGHRYGTRKAAIEEITSSGRDVVMDIDIQGGMSIKDCFPDALLIFIVPPSESVLEGRLRGRATDDEEVIRTRLRNAIEELKWAPRYDHRVVNDDLETAVAEVLAIIARERSAREQSSRRTGCTCSD
jgi:guanylate kinase